MSGAFLLSSTIAAFDAGRQIGGSVSALVAAGIALLVARQILRAFAWWADRLFEVLAPFDWTTPFAQMSIARFALRSAILLGGVALLIAPPASREQFTNFLIDLTRDERGERTLSRREQVVRATSMLAAAARQRLVAARATTVHRIILRLLLITGRARSFTGKDGQRWSYRLDRQIGDAGSHGVVYQGTGRTGQPVAVKVVRLRSNTEKDRQLREREVEIGGRLPRSEYLMPQLDVGRVGTDLMLVMPRADRSLAAAIRANDLDLMAGLETVRDVAHSLVVLGDAEMVHRDIKPANVLRLAGRWVVADFSISRPLSGPADRYTCPHYGTPQYRAPELWINQPATVHSDMYALGVLAYEVLTGDLPFAGTEDWSTRHLHDVPSPLPRVVPAEVRRVVLSLLAKDPAARPDARAVVACLDVEIRRLES